MVVVFPSSEVADVALVLYGCSPASIRTFQDGVVQANRARLCREEVLRPLAFFPFPPFSANAHEHAECVQGGSAGACLLGECRSAEPCL